MSKYFFPLKQSLLFILGLLLFSNMTQIYWTFKYERLNEIPIRLALASLLSISIGLLALILFKGISRKINKKLSVIIVYLSLFLWLMSVGIFISLKLGLSYKPYLPIMALASFCIVIARNHKYIVASLLFISVSTPILWYSIIIYQFTTIEPKTLSQLPRNMLWAHRGFTQGHPENSIESFDAAERMGYYGIELDIHFLERKGFVVIHDLPQDGTCENCLTLTTVFDRYRDHFYYWLDFKNLDLNNATKSGRILSEYIKLYTLEGHVFVESMNAKALKKLKLTVPQINTIYWIRGNLKNRFTLFRMKYGTVISRTDTVSMPVHHVSDIYFNNFSHLNMAVFTVNNAKRIEHFFKKGVRIVLTDVDMKTKFPSTFRH